MAEPTGLLEALKTIKTDYGKGSGSDRATKVKEFESGITRPDGKALEKADDLMVHFAKLTHMQDEIRRRPMWE